MINNENARYFFFVEIQVLQFFTKFRGFFVLASCGSTDAQVRGRSEERASKNKIQLYISEKQDRAEYVRC